ncbi:aspartate ammonia-lyase, partial [Providencia stuartii]|uniref:lyase family protein n=1 Tax=Providencia stuartii TaxID=588 RepID=UPI0033224BDB
SQSTNDAYPTGFRIAVYNSVVKLIESVEYLKKGFEKKAEEYNLKRSIELLLEVNLGATAIGTGLNTAPGYQKLAVEKLAEVTG